MKWSAGPNPKPTSSRKEYRHPHGHHTERRPPKSPCERGVAQVPRRWTRAAARRRQRNPRPRLQPPGSPWIRSCRRSSCWTPSSCGDRPALRRLQQGPHASKRPPMQAHLSLLLLWTSVPTERLSRRSSGAEWKPKAPIPGRLCPFTSSNRNIYLLIFQKSFYSITVICPLNRQ